MDEDQRKGAWSAEEDRLLTKLIRQYGTRNWSIIAAGVKGRSGKSCRLRWHNQLNPDVRKDPFSEWEDAVIIQGHQVHGNKWAAIAKLLPGRTDNAVKNHWNATLKRKCQSGSIRNRFFREGLGLQSLLSMIDEMVPADVLASYRANGGGNGGMGGGEDEERSGDDERSGGGGGEDMDGEEEDEMRMHSKFRPSKRMRSNQGMPTNSYGSMDHDGQGHHLQLASSLSLDHYHQSTLPLPPPSNHYISSSQSYPPITRQQQPSYTTAAAAGPNGGGGCDFRPGSSGAGRVPASNSFSGPVQQNQSAWGADSGSGAAEQWGSMAGGALVAAAAAASAGGGGGRVGGGGSGYGMLQNNIGSPQGSIRHGTVDLFPAPTAVAPTGQQWLHPHHHNDDHHRVSGMMPPPSASQPSVVHTAQPSSKSRIDPTTASERLAQLNTLPEGLRSCLVELSRVVCFLSQQSSAGGSSPIGNPGSYSHAGAASSSAAAARQHRAPVHPPPPTFNHSPAHTLHQKQQQQQQQVVGYVSGSCFPSQAVAVTPLSGQLSPTVTLTANQLLSLLQPNQSMNESNLLGLLNAGGSGSTGAASQVQHPAGAVHQAAATGLMNNMRVTTMATGPPSSPSAAATGGGAQQQQQAGSEPHLHQLLGGPNGLSPRQLSNLMMLNPQGVQGVLSQIGAVQQQQAVNGQQYNDAAMRLQQEVLQYGGFSGPGGAEPLHRRGLSMELQHLLKDIMGGAGGHLAAGVGGGSGGGGRQQPAIHHHQHPQHT